MRGETIALQLDGPAPRPGRQRHGEIVIEGEAADSYVRRLQRALSAARVNAYVPHSRRLASHLGFLGPFGSHGLYRQLSLSPHSGLPAVREILRVKIDRDLCAEFLADAAERSPPPPESQLAWRIAYYSELARCEVMPLNRMSIELRQRRPDEGVADFRVVFDRLDLASSQFVRYTILLSQRDRAWARRQVELERDIPLVTEGFRGIISRFAADEAELAFVLLSGVEGIEVEDLWRCRVGKLGSGESTGRLGLGEVRTGLQGDDTCLDVTGETGGSNCLQSLGQGIDRQHCVPAGIGGADTHIIKRAG